jgi:hypothetical protein
VDQGRDIVGIGVAVADEAFAFSRLEDCGLESPLRPGRVTEGPNRAYMNSSAPITKCETQQPGVSDIPSGLEAKKISCRNGKTVTAKQILKAA